MAWKAIRVGLYNPPALLPATVTAETDVLALVWKVSEWKSLAEADPKAGYQLAVHAGKVLFSRVNSLKDHLINDIAWGMD